MALNRHTIVHALSSGKFSYELDDDDDAMTGNVTSNGLSDLEDPADEEQNNPLLIDVIIQRLLEYCEPNSLFSCRLVCKKWTIEAWKEIKKRTLITIKSMDSIPNSLRPSMHLSRLEFSDFNVRLTSSKVESLLATTGVHVKDLSLQFNDKQLNFDQLKLFLESMPNLETLAVMCLPCDLFRQQNGCVSEELNELKPLLKLTSLTLGERCHFDVERPEEAERFFFKLLSFMPNLEQLTGKLGWSVSHFIKALDSLHLEKLAHLGLVGAFTRESAVTLEKLRLRSLYLGVGTHYNEDNHHNVIYAQRESLQALGVGWSSFHSRVTREQLMFEFPQLKFLSLCDASKWDLRPCPKAYLACPGIQKFQVDIRVVSDFEFIARNPCFENVKELDISFSLKTPSVCEEYLTSALNATFPILRRLTLRASLDFPFGLIFKLLPDLEELAIHFVCSLDIPEELQMLVYLDSLLIGTEESRCAHMRQYLCITDMASVMNEALALLRDAREQNCSKMPLSSLQNLKKLSILTFLGRRVTCVTAQLCLWIMPNLASITIDKAVPGVEETLRKVFPPTTFIHTVCYRDQKSSGYPDDLQMSTPSEKRCNIRD